MQKIMSAIGWMFLGMVIITKIFLKNPSPLLHAIHDVELRKAERKVVEKEESDEKTIKMGFQRPVNG